LFANKKLRASSIEGHKTAIADGLKFVSQLDVAGDDRLKSLIKSFHRDQPVLKSMFPKWNLALVLNFLTQKPFEPLQEAALKFLTWKTAFLLLLATGGRSSEIHALEYSSLKFHEGYHFLTVEPIPEFKAKNQGISIDPNLQYYKIPALAPTLDRALPDRTLCPVRATKIYRARTEDLRKGKKARRLFISYKKGFQEDIRKNTFSSWIKQLIHFSYVNCPDSIIPLSQAHPHETRGLAASLCVKANISIGDIMSGCTWKKHTTFTDFYLKDICLIQDDLHFLGPIVAARKVIHI